MQEDEQKQKVQQYFDESENWGEKLYVDQSHSFNRLLVRRKEYAFAMLDRLSDVAVSTALDIGCGPGAYVEELRKRGFDAYGVDISQKMLDVCKERLGVSEGFFRSHLKLGDIEQLPFDRHFFDLVICVGVLGNLFSDDKALEEMQRVLKPNGLLLLAVENMMSLSNIDYVWRRRLRSFIKLRSSGEGDHYTGVTMPSTWWTPHTDGIYYKLYNPWKLEKIMKQKGFCLVDAMTVGHEFRIFRRLKIAPEPILSATEVWLETFFRALRMPYFRHSGQF